MSIATLAIPDLLTVPELFANGSSMIDGFNYLEMLSTLDDYDLLGVTSRFRAILNPWRPILVLVTRHAFHSAMNNWR